MTWWIDRQWTAQHVAMLMAVCLASIAAGVFASFFPQFAILAVGGAAFLAVVGYFRSFLLSGIFFCGTVTILRDINIGPISAMGMLTIYLMGASLFFWLVYRRWSSQVFRTLFPYTLFIIWAFMTMLWSSASFTGFQNLLVMTTFLTFMLLSAEQSRRDEGFQRQVLSAVILATWVAAGVYLVTRFMYGADIEIGVGARGFALMALVGAGCGLARWRYDSTKGALHTMGIISLIAFSLSRTATVVGILLYPLSRWNPASVGGWARLTAWGGAAIAALVVLITQVDALRSRFVEGDMAMEVAGVPINAMGRTRFWNTTLQSHADAPWLGKGAGSAEQLIADIFGISHPHNDYLRVLHDFGRIGLALWLLAFLFLIVATIRGWIIADRAHRSDAATHLAGFLGLVAVAATMVTDNVIVYVFVMAPLGAIVGASLGRSATYISQPDSTSIAQPLAASSGPAQGAIRS